MRAFLSYTHFDDEHNERFITEFRKNLSNEVRSQTGEEFLIFQDQADIEWGQNWRLRIEKEISEANFLIPIITPSFFKSSPCQEELDKFLKREEDLHRNDLILPLYFIDTPLLNDSKNELAQAITSHQYVDWRQWRFESFTSPPVRKALAELATQIKKAIDRTAERTKNATEQAKNSFTQSIIEFGDRPVSEIMRPRQEMVMIDASKSVAEARSLMVETKHSCIPVYRGQFDNIEGSIHVRDLLAYCEPEKEDLPVTECIRPVYFVPDTKSIALIFEEMQQVEEMGEDNKFMVMVINEYGGVVGMITIRDVINYLFGSNGELIEDAEGT